MFKIFEQLESPDIFKVSEVCKYWLEASQHPKLVNKTIVKLYSLENNRFLKSWRKFNFKLKLDTHMAENFFKFNEKFSENITEIEFFCIFLPCLDSLRQYLEKLNNLKSLIFHDCRFFNLSTVPDVQISLNVTSLVLRGLYLTDILVDYIFSITTNLEVLTACFGNGSFNSSIVKYLKNPELTKSLNELNVFDGQLIVLYKIFKLEHLNLQKFVWHSYSKTTSEHIQVLQTFLTRQKNLKVLEIDINSYMNPNVRLVFLSQVIMICSLNSLENLTLNCRLVKDMNSLDFEPIWNLKILKLISADLNIFKALSKISKMKSLTLDEFREDINDTEITDKFKFLTNLKVFKLVLDDRDLNLYIKNQLLQATFKHLIHLEELEVHDKLPMVSSVILGVINFY